MKELSIEEKAKAYDEAIEKGKQILNAPYTAHWDIMKEVAEHILPEIKESDGEKIRKALIEGFKVMKAETYGECTFSNYNIPVTDIIAWLEKQGEQNPADINPLLSWSSEEEKMLQCLEGIVKDYWAKSEQEKNELKIREASNVSFFLKTIHKSPLCWIKCSDRLPNRDGIYLVVTDGIHNDVYDMARYDSIEGWHKASEIIYWMPIPQLNDKSIIEQKPEWNEEDEKILNSIISHFEEGHISTYKNRKTIDWLKSLRPQSTWKPSDEQMEALKSSTYCQDEQMSKVLFELYQQLKKLREE